MPLRSNFGKTPIGLKYYLVTVPTFSGSSAALVPTQVTATDHPGVFHLRGWESTGPPRVSISDFVMDPMIEHLMRRKRPKVKGSVKYRPRNNGDIITHMEGAMHTFVVALVEGLIHADYNVAKQQIVHFPYVKEERRQAQGAGAGDDESTPETPGAEERPQRRYGRKVIISTMVPLDFETEEVMFKVCRSTTKTELYGEAMDENFEILHQHKKWHSPDKAAKYEAMLWRWMRENLYYDESHMHPDYRPISVVLTTPEAIAYIREYLALDSPWSKISMQDEFVLIYSYSLQAPVRLSLEVLFNAAVHQLRNELSVLEHCCPQGYVYTYDPSEIHSQILGSTALLFHVMIGALKHIACTTGEGKLKNMRVFAVSGVDRTCLYYVAAALQTQKHVKVVAREKLFPEPECLYKAPPGCEDALLVIHNNGCGFQLMGAESGDLDGYVGLMSSAAASLKADRFDLLSWIL